jgi:hypothetical protein
MLNETPVVVPDPNRSCGGYGLPKIFGDVRVSQLAKALGRLSHRERSSA